MAIVLVVGCGGGGNGGGVPDGGTADSGVLVDSSTPDAGFDAGPPCIDGDSDLHGADCALGPDCDDADPNSFTQCTSCVDADGDHAYVGCDAYASVAGPDCDDAEPQRSPLLAEIPDNGLDDDCDGSSLLAATATSGTFVALGGTCSDSGAGRGTRSTPYCSLATAVAERATGDFYVAEAHHAVDRLTFGSGNVRVFGGYSAADWSRDIMVHTTTVDVTSTTRGDLVTFPGGGAVVIDGIDFVGVPLTGGANGEFVLSVGLASRVEVRRVGVDASDYLGAIDIAGSSTVHPDVVVVVLDARCSDTSPSTTGTIICLKAQDVGTVEVSYSQVGVHTVGRDLHAINVYGADSLALLNDAIVASSTASSSRIVSAGSMARLEAIDSSIYLRSQSNSYGGVFEIGDIGETVLVNTATESSSAQTVWLFEYANTLGQLTARANVFHETSGLALAEFVQRTTIGGQPMHFYTAAELNACSTACVDVGGNSTDDPLFTGAAAGDFRPLAGSPLVDMGVDATLYATTPGVAFSFSAARPQNGIWDIGVFEN